MKRSSGILMHVTSLPSPYGIGTFGKEACEFVDFLASAGQKYWQVLPLGPTGKGDSPYQPLSSFAGNPYFIDLDILTSEGLLEKSHYEVLDFGKNPVKVDYGKIFSNKMKVLKMAYRSECNGYYTDICRFKEENKGWLEEYALYMALKEKFHLKSWHEWHMNFKLREKTTLEYCREDLRKEMDYWIFIQYLFSRQWKNLKSYANKRGVEIIGDIPIYAAYDSADTWSESSNFLFDEDMKPVLISGCPPDDFSREGQLWGNPVYHWDYLESTGYKWWIERMKRNANLYDVVRIDHFRGLESFWGIPPNGKASQGRWIKGPGMKLIVCLKKSLGKTNIIVEDLGHLTEEVHRFKMESGYAGMEVLQFAFNPEEDSKYLPHNHVRNSVVYPGTHDNEPIMAWIKDIPKANADFAKDYFKLTSEEGYNWGFIRGAMGSVASVAIIQMQDYLGLGSEGIMNIPSTAEGNWQWRMKKGCLTDVLANKINKMASLYKR